MVDVDADSVELLPPGSETFPALAVNCRLESPCGDGHWSEYAVDDWKRLVGKIDGGLFFMKVLDKCTEEDIYTVDLINLPADQVGGSEVQNLICTVIFVQKIPLL